MYIITVIDKLEIFSGRYLGSFWNWVRLLSLCLMHAAIGVYVWRSVLTASTVEEVMNNRGNQRYMNYIDYSINYLN